MTAMKNRHGYGDVSFVLAACASRTTVAITSAWITMLQMLTPAPTKN
jgi:hypothetical protein